MIAVDQLEPAILAAHAAGNERSLAELYGQAGDVKLAHGDIDAACFFHTQAYVFALSSGHHSQASRSHQLLVLHGREA